MKIIIDEVNEIDTNKLLNGEFILVFTDFDENIVELGFDKRTLELLFNKIKEIKKWNLTSATQKIIRINMWSVLNMAAVDKTFGTIEQWYALYGFIEKHKKELNN